MKIITFEEAKKQGLKTYFTNVACIHGHVTVRYIVSKRCKGCLDAKNLRYKESHKKTQAKWYQANKSKEKERALQWYYDNKEHSRLVKAEYRKKHPHVHKAKLAKRRASKKQAIPLWADLEKIKEVYKNCPKGMHVDHVVPLQSELVCGLHVEYNLQYLTPRENSSKGNKIMYDNL